MSLKSRKLLIGLCVLLQAACGGQAVYKGEDFATDSPFKMRTVGEVGLACESARRALLGQGYMIDSASGEGVRGRKAYKQESTQNAYIEMNVVCLPEEGGSTLFANGLLSAYELKKSASSASVGVSALGSISLPIGQSADSLVKVSEETINDPEFYRRFFAAIEIIITEMQAARMPPESPPEPASEPVAPESPPGVVPVSAAPIPVHEPPAAPVPAPTVAPVVAVPPAVQAEPAAPVVAVPPAVRTEPAAPVAPVVQAEPAASGPPQVAAPAVTAPPPVQEPPAPPVPAPAAAPAGALPAPVQGEPVDPASPAQVTAPAAEGVPLAAQEPPLAAEAIPEPVEPEPTAPRKGDPEPPAPALEPAQGISAASGEVPQSRDAALLELVPIVVTARARPAPGPLREAAPGGVAEPESGPSQQAPETVPDALPDSPQELF